jgi:uncharacterized protein YndB with AHSA1/START domain
MSSSTDTDQYVNITRAFAAPRAVVWKFWTQPEYLAQWFGPDSVHVPVDSVEIDLRVGGVWNLVMVDNETGAQYPLRSVITELIDQELLVSEAEANTDGGLITVTIRAQFHDHGDVTRLTFTQGPFNDIQKHQTIEGWQMSWIALDTILERSQA